MSNYLTGDIRIATLRGAQKIADLVDKDEVFVLDREGKYHKATISQQNTPADLTKITFLNGQTLITGSQQLWPTKHKRYEKGIGYLNEYDRIKSSEELKKYDKIEIPRFDNAATNKYSRAKKDEGSYDMNKNFGIGLPEKTWTSTIDYISGVIEQITLGYGNLDVRSELKHSEFTLKYKIEKVLKDLQRLLSFFGIYARVFYRPEKRHRSWTFYIRSYDAIRLFELFDIDIAYINVFKQDLFKLPKAEMHKRRLEMTRVRKTETYTDSLPVYKIDTLDNSETILTESGITLL